MVDSGADPGTAPPEDEVDRHREGETKRRGPPPLVVAVGVTLAVTAISYAAPLDYAATAVGGAFIVAVIWLVLRFDAPTVRHFGLSLGGLLEPGPIEPRRLLRDGARAAAWTLGLAVVDLRAVRRRISHLLACPAGLPFSPPPVVCRRAARSGAGHRATRSRLSTEAIS